MSDKLQKDIETLAKHGTRTPVQRQRDHLRKAMELYEGSKPGTYGRRDWREHLITKIEELAAAIAEEKIHDVIGKHLEEFAHRPSGIDAT
jgi:hypothetical protein